MPVRWLQCVQKWPKQALLSAIHLYLIISILLLSHASQPGPSPNLIPCLHSPPHRGPPHSNAAAFPSLLITALLPEITFTRR